MNKEIEKFTKWCYHEINHNEMVALGPLRFKAEHKNHKNNTVTPIKWLNVMAKNMSVQSEEPVTPAQVAEEFNQMIDDGSITPFITRSAKYIIKEAVDEYQEDPEKFKEKYKELPQKPNVEIPIDFANEKHVVAAIAKSSQKYNEIVNAAINDETLPSGDSNDSTNECDV